MKIFTGVVISKKMEKTATVVVDRVIVHPVYKKRVRRRKKYQVHDEVGTEVGQMVKFATSKPYSKSKRWKILEIAGAKKTNEKQRTTDTADLKTITPRKSVKSRKKSV